MAMASTLIAGKVEECCRRVRDVVNIFFYLFQKLLGQSPRLLAYISDEYYAWRDRVTTTEMHLLRQLGFHVQPRHPIGLLANYLNALELSEDPRVAQRAINLINDALRGVAYACWPPEVIACAAIAEAAEFVGGIELPDAPRWHLVFDVAQVDLVDCQRAMKTVYRTQLRTDLLVKLAKPQPPVTLEPLSTSTPDQFERHDSDSKAVTLKTTPDHPNGPRRGSQDRPRSRSRYRRRRDSHSHSHSDSKSRSRSNSRPRHQSSRSREGYSKYSRLEHR